jgi:hypothetical protein
VNAEEVEVIRLESKVIQVSVKSGNVLKLYYETTELALSDYDRVLKSLQE